MEAASAWPFEGLSPRSLGAVSCARRRCDSARGRRSFGPQLADESPGCSLKMRPRRTRTCEGAPVSQGAPVIPATFGPHGILTSGGRIRYRLLTRPELINE